MKTQIEYDLCTRLLFLQPQEPEHHLSLIVQEKSHYHTLNLSICLVLSIVSAVSLFTIAVGSVGIVNIGLRFLLLHYIEQMFTVCTQ